MKLSDRVAHEAAIYLAAAILTVAGWWLCVRVTGVQAYLLPSPAAVLSNMWAERATLLQQSGVTAWETVLGFAVSVAIAIPVAMLMSEWRIVYSLGYPLVVGLQTLPKIAVAPLLVVALGFGIAPKVITVVLVAFFPIVINALAGFRSVDADMHNLGRILGFDRLRFFWRISLPQALPAIFAGLKVAMTLALIGAVVAEFVGADEGLGHLLLSASARLDSTLSFSALIALTLLGLVLYAAVALLEWAAVPWRRISEAELAAGR
jgi:NitT/TauT family transport system permease protein